MIDPQSAEGRERLSAALGVARWVDEVASAGPYPTVAALVEASARVGTTLTDAELDEAAGLASPTRLSAAEQAGLGAKDEGVDAAIARGDAVYQERFGRVFLIRAAGRSRQEVLDELQRRLKNDEATEAEEAKEQLRQIAALRLGTLFEDDA